MSARMNGCCTVVNDYVRDTRPCERVGHLVKVHSDIICLILQLGSCDNSYGSCCVRV